jgi:Zn-dependent protease with chaperone function
MRAASSSLVVLAAVLTAGTLLVAQTPIKLPKNKYTPEQDVEIGLKGAAEVRKQYPIIKDEAIARYLTGLGDRLVAVAPANLNQKVYRYSFTPVNLKEINAFALPGGPMFVHRGMIDAAAVEGEVVGVMAHELAHVLLRHGTANATKAQNPWLQLGQIAGQVGGAMVGGNTGALIAEGSGFGLGTLMLRYGRDYEKQADLLGSQIMARAGYDPRDLAHMFETIAGESKGGAPQWMSSHPNPGNRTQYITKEAEMLKIEGKADTSGFQVARQRFAGMPPAMTMAELAKRGPGGGGSGTGTTAAESVGTPGKPVPAPSAQVRTINAGVFQASVPSNWKNLQSDSTIKAVPENGYGELNGQTVFTHGVEFGVAKASSRDLKEATATWLKAIAQGNPELKQAGESKYVKMSERTALGIPLINPSPLGGQEAILLFTTFLTNGDLFYYLAVAPEPEMKTYQPVFVKIGQSIKITDVR